MPLSFPISPSEAQVFVSGTRSWTYTSGAWVPTASTPGSSFSGTAGSALTANQPVYIDAAGKIQPIASGFPVGLSNLTGLPNFSAAATAYDHVTQLIYFIGTLGGVVNCMVGKLEGGFISWGPMFLTGASATSVAISYMGSNKCVIGYRQSDVTTVTCQAFSVNTATLVMTGGTALVVSTSIAPPATTFTDGVAVVSDTEGTGCVVLMPNSSWLPTARWLPLSGVTLSLGSFTSLAGYTSGTNIEAVFNTASGKAVFLWANTTNVTAVSSSANHCCTISLANPPVFGPPTQVPIPNIIHANASTTYKSRIVSDPNSSRVLVSAASQVDASNSTPQVVVGSLFGNGITFGAPATMSVTAASATPNGYNVSAGWDGATPGVILTMYRAAAGAGQLYASLFTCSGVDLSAVYRDALVRPGSPTESGNTLNYVIQVSQGALFRYTGSVIGTVTQSWTLAASFAPRYIGFTRAAAALNAAVEVVIFGGVATGFTGLVMGNRYYVLSNGAISTNADASATIAGVAISTSSLLVGA